MTNSRITRLKENTFKYTAYTMKIFPNENWQTYLTNADSIKIKFPFVKKNFYEKMELVQIPVLERPCSVVSATDSPPPTAASSRLSGSAGNPRRPHPALRPYMLTPMLKKNWKESPGML
jgi:hypothetical protein